jgi:hypothetical protein
VGTALRHSSGDRGYALIKTIAPLTRELAQAAAYEEETRTRAVEIRAVLQLQITRNWVLRFKAHGPSGLIDLRAPDQPGAS